jgi:hypothetical protein
MKDEKRVRAKDGRSGIAGICAVCGGKMFKMIGSGAKTRIKTSAKKLTTKQGKGKGKAKIKRR